MLQKRSNLKHKQLGESNTCMITRNTQPLTWNATVITIGEEKKDIKAKRHDVKETDW